MNKIRLIALLFSLAFFMNFMAEAKVDQRLNPVAINYLRKSPKNSYKFIVTGDNREGDEIFLKILKDARKHQPEFAVHTGDFVAKGGYGEYRRFMSYLKRSTFPVIPAIGNHEIYQKGRRWYNQFFGPTYFAFNYGNDRFIYLDNADGKLSNGQLKWLEGQLKIKSRYTFLAMHMPPMNIVWWHAFEEGAKAMVKLAQKYKVNYAFFGHIHIYDKRESKGVKFIVSGGAGAPLFRMPLYFSPEGGAFNHYLLIEVDDKGIKEKVVRLNQVKAF